VKLNEIINKKKINHTPAVLIKFLNLSIATNLGLLILVVFTYTHPIQPKYFSTSFNGAVKAITNISEPNTSDYAVLQWANIAAISALTYDFVNYETQLKNASQFFTAEGWDMYMKALNSSNNLQEVVAKKLIVNVVAIKPPIILQKGYLNGSYSWRIQIPVLITYKSATSLSPQNLVITMLVSRVPTLESYKGLGIKQFLSLTYDIADTTTIVQSNQ